MGRCSILYGDRHTALHKLMGTSAVEPRHLIDKEVGTLVTYSIPTPSNVITMSGSFDSHARFKLPWRLFESESIVPQSDSTCVPLLAKGYLSPSHETWLSMSAHLRSLLSEFGVCQSQYNTILERLLVWVQNPLGLFLSRSFLSYSIKPSSSELGNVH